MEDSEVRFTRHVQRAVKSNRILGNFFIDIRRNVYVAKKYFKVKKYDTIVDENCRKYHYNIFNEINCEIFQIVSKSRIELGFFDVRYSNESEQQDTARICCKQAIGVEKLGRRDFRFNPNTN